MTQIKALSLVLCTVVLAFFLNSCEETAVAPETPLAVPAGVTNLRANSTNDSTITIKWNASVNAAESYFKGYVIKVGTQKFSTGVNTNEYEITGLEEGEIYELSVYASNTKDSLSTAAKIQWSPASRFVKRSADDEPFMMYETVASTGSGLDLFDEEVGEPYTVTVGQGAKWNVGINTKDGDFLFGSANKLGYNFTGTPASAEIAEPVIANSIDDVWDTEALDKKTFSEKTFDLNDAKYAGKKMVFVVRTMVGASDYQYAKIFLDATLKGSAGSRYVECQISYQKKAGVPYAIHP